MTEKDKQTMADRKAVREICRTMEKSLERAERMVTALTQKLESAEKEILELKRKNLELRK